MHLIVLWFDESTLCRHRPSKHPKTGALPVSSELRYMLHRGCGKSVDESQLHKLGKPILYVTRNEISRFCFKQA